MKEKVLLFRALFDYFVRALGNPSIPKWNGVGEGFFLVKRLCGPVTLRSNRKIPHLISLTQHAKGYTCWFVGD